VDNFKLPGYLEFPYNCRHLVPLIDTVTGFRISEEANTIEHFDQLLKSYNNTSTFYTDGSRLDIENRMGYAIFCPETNLEIKVRINNFCSIFEAEASAILLHSRYNYKSKY